MKHACITILFIFILVFISWGVNMFLLDDFFDNRLFRFITGIVAIILHFIL
jgi:hypothetical protein